jgi:pimeloyl-ACP methyl ester carboxylesterase
MEMTPGGVGPRRTVRRLARWLGGALVAWAAATVVLCSLPPDRGASWLVRPPRRPVPAAAEHLLAGAEPLEVEVAPGLVLRGMLARADPARRRGLVVALHGVGDNHAGSGPWLGRELRPLGFDVVAYSARAHGNSGGEYCTYGFHERHDVSRVLDAVQARSGGALVGPVVLLGHSMGAAVALQAAPDDPRVTAVIAVAPFSDMAAAIQDYTPFVLPRLAVRRALARAEELAAFRIAEVSPLRAVAQLKVPLLLVHGVLDKHLPPRHSRALLAAASPAARAQLALVHGAGHNNVLSDPDGWRAIVGFLQVVVPKARAQR